MSFELKGWHVLSMMLGFFGLVIGVNVVLAVYALGTFAGEDVSMAYLKGLAYNQTLDARAAQAQLGWKAEISAQRSASGSATIEVRIVEADGQGLSGLEVTGLLRRPTNAALDRTIKLADAGGGYYTAPASGLAHGQWDIIVSTTAPNGAAFEAMRRVQLP